MKKNISIFLFIIAVMAQPLSAAEPVIGDYSSLPVFTANAVKPNILIMFDNSGSMNFNAYGTYPGDYGTVDDVPYAGTSYTPAFEKRIATGTDDSEEQLSNHASWTSGGGDLDMGNFYGTSASASMIGLRFQDIEIPPGSEITSAYIEFTANNTNTVLASETMKLKISGQNTNDAPTFNGSVADISGRSQTQKNVFWSPNDWTANGTYQSPELKTIIQEIVDMDGWISGSNLVLILENQTITNEKRDAIAYEGDSAKAPMIHIEYTQSQGKRYYGYFNPDWFYTYGSNKFDHAYEKVDYNSTCSGEWYVRAPGSLTTAEPWAYKCLSDADISSAGESLWDGNWLNWSFSRRIDVARKVLMGGFATSRTGGGNQTNYAECPDQKDRVFKRQFESTGAAVTPYDGDYLYTFGCTGNYGTFEVDGVDYTLGINKREWFEPEDFKDGNLAGVLQRIGEDQAWWGNEFFYYGDGTNKEGGLIDNPVGTNLTTLITDIQNTPANTWTPLGEAMYVAMQYFKQEKPDSSLGYFSGAIGAVNDAMDPYYQDKEFVPCAKSFVLMITDGASTKDLNIPDYLKDYDNDGNDPGTYASNGSDYLDDIALYARTNDLRADLDGEQNILLYPVYAFGNDDNARGLLKDAARNGGFDDKNGNGLPDGSYSDAPEDRLEWDKNGDRLPDTYFEAQDGYTLESKLLEAIYDILRRAASGTAVSVLATSSEGEGTLVQAYFRPVVTQGINEIKWVGYLQSLWVDEYGFLREDTDQNLSLDLDTDKVLTYYIDDNGNTRVNKWGVSAGSEYPDFDVDIPVDHSMEDIAPLWEAGKVLAKRDPDTRTIFTYTDSAHTTYHGGLDFAEANSALIKPFLGVEDTTAWSYMGPSPAERSLNLIKYIRGYGEGFSGATSMRSRTLNVDGLDWVWKLGDIVHSTPVSLQVPPENFGLIYSDVSYHEFFTFHKYRSDRENVVYVGGNDGAIHAFTSWQYDASSKTFVNPGIDMTEEVGTELWAYIPKALLPHLKWLPSQDYIHTYYVDLTPKLTDAKIFYNTLGDSTSGTIIGDDYHKNGWGTVLIGGLRMGGKPIDVTDDFNYDGSVTTETFSSSIFVIDVSNPRNPEVLWERSYDGLDLTTSNPSVIKVGEKWFVVFGSGPEDYDGSSTTSGKIFVVDLATGNPYKNGANDWLFETSEDDAFMGGSASLDKGLNYNVDALYIGETYDDSPKGWKGAMYKVRIPWTCSGTASDCDPAQDISTSIDYGSLTQGSYNNDPLTWSLSKLFDSPAPVTAPPSLSIDFQDNAWIYFGTGRYLSNADKTSTDTNYLIGIKDPYFNEKHIVPSPLPADYNDPTYFPESFYFADNYYINNSSSLSLTSAELFDSDIYKVIHPWGTFDTPAGDCTAVPVGQIGDIYNDGSCIGEYQWPVATCTETVAGACTTELAAAGIVMGEELFVGVDCECAPFNAPEWGCLDRVAGSCDGVVIAQLDDNANFHSFFYRCQEATEGDCLGVTLGDIDSGTTPANCTCEIYTDINFTPIEDYYVATERPAGVCSDVVPVPIFGDEGDYYDSTGGLCVTGYWTCTETVDGSGACDTVDYTLTSGFLGAAGDGDYFGNGSCMCTFVDDPAPVVTTTTSNLGYTFEDMVDAARMKDGWIRTLVDVGERSITKPALLGGITLFTTYVPSADICSFGGYSWLYGLYFETGTPYKFNVFDTNFILDSNGDLVMPDRFYLGIGMASGVGIHVGKESDGKAKGFIQQSTGLIGEVELDPAFTIRSGLRYWREN